MGGFIGPFEAARRRAERLGLSVLRGVSEGLGTFAEGGLSTAVTGLRQVGIERGEVLEQFQRGRELTRGALTPPDEPEMGTIQRGAEAIGELGGTIGGFLAASPGAVAPTAFRAGAAAGPRAFQAVASAVPSLFTAADKIEEGDIPGAALDVATSFVAGPSGQAAGRRFLSSLPVELSARMEPMVEGVVRRLTGSAVGGAAVTAGTLAEEGRLPTVGEAAPAVAFGAMGAIPGEVGGPAAQVAGRRAARMGAIVPARLGRVERPAIRPTEAGPVAGREPGFTPTPRAGEPTLRERLGAITERSGRQAAGLPAAEEAAGMAGNINLRNIQSTDDVKAVIRNVAEVQRPLIDEARRGRVTEEETRRLADELGMTYEKLLSRRKGQAFNAEEAMAARQLLATSSEDVVRLSERAGSGDENALAEFAAALRRHEGIQQEVAGIAAEAGRSLRAHAMAVSAIDRPELARRKIMEAIGSSPENLQEIAKRLSQIDVNDPVAVNRFIREATRATTTDKIYEAWINGLLSGPVTHVANFTSNLLTRVVTPVERGAAAGIDLARATFTGGPRQRFFGEVAADIYGMGAGLVDGVRAGARSFIAEMPTEAIERLEVGRRGAIKGRLGEVIRLPSRALLASDEFFKAINGRAALQVNAYRRAAREGLTGPARAQRIAEILLDPPPDIRSDVAAERLYRTFQAELGQTGRGIQMFRNSHPLIKFVMPFLTTPINIAKYGLERTPLSVLRTGVRAARGRVGPGEAADELSRAAVGSTIAAATAVMATRGLITGGGPKDPEERNALLATGWQPYSVRIGDNWVQYGRLEPISTVVGLTADAVELGDSLEKEDAAGKVGLAIAKNLTSKTFLTGISDLLNAVSDPERYGEQWIDRMAGTAIPTGVAQVARAVDPTIRRARGIEQTLQRRIPGASMELSPLRNIWGEVVLSPASSAERLLSPFRRSEITEDAASREVVRLGVEVGTPRRQLGKVELDDATYDRYTERAGAIARESVNLLMSAPSYRFMEDENKAEAIRRIFVDSRRRARGELGIRGERQ